MSLHTTWPKGVVLEGWELSCIVYVAAQNLATGCSVDGWELSYIVALAGGGS